MDHPNDGQSHERGVVGGSTITVTAEDQKAVLRGYRSQSRGMLWIILMVVLLTAGAALLSSIDDSWGDPEWFAIVALAIIVVLVSIVFVSSMGWVRRQLPIGSEIGLRVADEGLYMSSPSGDDLILWHRLSNLKRVGGGVFFNCEPSKIQLAVPGRLVSEEDFASFGQQIEVAARTAQEEHVVSPTPTASTADSANTFVITATASDQKNMARLMRRRFSRLLLISTACALVGIAGVVMIVWGVLPGPLLAVFLTVAGIGCLLVATVVRGIGKNTKSAFPLGAEQRLVLREEGLEVTGQLGTMTLPWDRLSDLKRENGAVFVTNTATKVVFVFSGRLVTDEAFAAINERIRHVTDRDG